MPKLIVKTFLYSVIVLTWMVVASMEKNFLFTRIENDIFEFQYELSDGSTFSGKTFQFWGKNVQVLIDANGCVYWISFSDDELNSTEPFYENVHEAKRTDDGISFKDEYFEYHLHIDPDGESYIKVLPYATEWNLSNVCFEKIVGGNGEFQFTLESTNNNLKYNGTTVADPDDPLKHKFKIKDHSRDGEYEVEFRKDEVDSNQTICKMVMTIYEFVILGAGAASNIDPNLIITLIG